MNRNEIEMNRDTQKLLKQARTMKKWELIEEAVYTHSRILKEIKKAEPEIPVIDQCKLRIAVIEQALSEKMKETGHLQARACREIYKEITSMFHFLFAMNEPAAFQLYGITSPAKQEATADIPFLPPVSRRSTKIRKVMRRS